MTVRKIEKTYYNSDA